MAKDRMALIEEGVQRTSESIIIEFFRRDIPKDVGAGVFGPPGNITQRDRAVQPGGHKQAQGCAVVVLGLWIGGDVLVDDASDGFFCHVQRQ